jgi:hypothetical protein
VSARCRRAIRWRENCSDLVGSDEAELEAFGGANMRGYVTKYVTKIGKVQLSGIPIALKSLAANVLCQDLGAVFDLIGKTHIHFLKTVAQAAISTGRALTSFSVFTRFRRETAYIS